MLAKVQKWGNSQGIRIPKSILENANISSNEDLDIKVGRWMHYPRTYSQASNTQRTT